MRGSLAEKFMNTEEPIEANGAQSGQAEPAGSQCCPSQSTSWLAHSDRTCHSPCLSDSPPVLSHHFGWEQPFPCRPACVPPDHEEPILHPISLGQPRAHGRLDRGSPRLSFLRTPWKILCSCSSASPSRPTGPPFSPGGFGSQTDCFFQSSSLDWLQASGSLWPKLKPGTIPEQVSSQCPVYLYSTNDWNHYAPDKWDLFINSILRWAI